MAGDRQHFDDAALYTYTLDYTQRKDPSLKRHEGDNIGPSYAVEEDESDKTALKDWNRDGFNGVILIDGKTVKEHRRAQLKLPEDAPQAQLQFQNRQDLENFFNEVLFAKVKDVGLREKLTKEGLNNFHQGGIMQASHTAIIGASSEAVLAAEDDSRDSFGLTSAPARDKKILFSRNEAGVKITEKVAFRVGAVNNVETGVEAVEVEPPALPYAEIKTTSAFVASNNILKVKLLSCDAKVYDEKLKTQFSEKSSVEKVISFFKKLFATNVKARKDISSTSDASPRRASVVRNRKEKERPVPQATSGSPQETSVPKEEGHKPSIR
jgi:hypothetical protein